MKSVSVLLSLLAWVVSCTAITAAQESSSPFMIILDGGSTGSRLHVFEFVTTEQVVRRGSKKAPVPLSAFARLHPATDAPLNASHLAEHLLDAFDYAATLIPAKYHATTTVKYQATAGMRLLDVSEQEAVYDALYEGLMASPTFVFRALQREDITTLSGHEEGLYGAMAANYLAGKINAKLELVTANTNSTSHNGKAKKSNILGALDLGGSSTQIVFVPEKEDTMTSDANSEADYDRMSCASPDSAGNGDNSHTCQSTDSTLRGDHFFSASYLSYGVDQMRERLWSTWVSDHQQKFADLQKKNIHATSSLGPALCDAKFIENPCSFKGYQTEWKGYTLVGTGNAQLCREEVARLLPHPELPVDDNTKPQRFMVGGREHPAVAGRSFLAMSNYFFALDAARVLSPRSAIIQATWPTPTLHELHEAVKGLCDERSWKEDLELAAHTAHAYTKAELLPHRCFEAVYVLALLQDGFGFDPTARDITFLYDIADSEVEWSLGMALTLHAERQQGDTAAPSASPAGTEALVSNDSEAEMESTPDADTQYCAWDGSSNPPSSCTGAPSTAASTSSPETSVPTQNTTHRSSTDETTAATDDERSSMSFVLSSSLVERLARRFLFALYHHDSLEI